LQQRISVNGITSRLCANVCERKIDRPRNRIPRKYDSGQKCVEKKSCDPGPERVDLSETDDKGPTTRPTKRGFSEEKQQRRRKVRRRHGRRRRRRTGRTGDRKVK